MNWDKIVGGIVILGFIVFAAVLAWKIWRGHPHPPLSDKDRRDFDDAGEW